MRLELGAAGNLTRILGRRPGVVAQGGVVRHRPADIVALRPRNDSRSSAYVSMLDPGIDVRAQPDYPFRVLDPVANVQPARVAFHTMTLYAHLEANGDTAFVVSRDLDWGTSELVSDVFE